ncbi:unnamed protein product [Larinioides sclopetarius]|uniref:Uncharacterized protein n=1 Tax=Larinioides sclopetarius TaxID=280406 RepID=A0AAV2B8W0_9ARAC
MDGKEDDLNCMFDDLYFNTDKQGRELRRRSSILKQTKNLNFDICEFEETEVRRKSQNPKRVSFADTFQVKEYPTGNIYDIPGRHELEASKNSSSSQIGLCLEAGQDNIGAVSREHVSTISLISHQELTVPKENCVVSSISFLEAEKENLGFVAKYSAPEILNVKTSSVHNSNYIESSKSSECGQNVQKNLPTKITPSTLSSFVSDPEQFSNKTRVTVDDMDITCLPSPKTESYPDETNNKTRFIVSDMEMTCIAGSDAFDENPSLPSNDVFLPENSLTSDEEESNQLILGKLNMVAPVSKKELSLNSMNPTPSFENIRLKSHSSSNTDFPLSTDSSIRDKISKKHPKNVLDGLIKEENFRLPSRIKGTKANCSEVSIYKSTEMDVYGTESYDPDKENFTDDENCHYSQNNTNGVKFMKIFSEKDNSQNRIQVFSSEKTQFPIPSTAFLEDKENIGFNRKRRSTEASSSEIIDVLFNKEMKHHLIGVKPLCLNSENDPKTSRDISNLTTPHSSSYVFKEINKPFSTQSNNVFPDNAININSKNRESSVNLENGCYYSSKDSTFKDRKCEYPLFDEKSSTENLKAPQSECDGMELTSITDNDNFHFIDGDSFEKKQQKEFCKDLNVDNFALTGIRRTCHYTSDKMELTCASKYNIELKERSSNSLLDIIDGHHSATMSEPSSYQFGKDTQPKNSRTYHLACAEKKNIPLNSRHNEINDESQFKNDANSVADISLNNYQDDKKEIMNQTIISHEMQLTCTYKTSVASPFFNLKNAYPIQSTGSCSPDFKTLPLNSDDDDSKVKKDASNFSKPFCFNEMDNSLLIVKKNIFQSNNMDITCNTESSSENSFNFGNNKNYHPDEDGKFGEMNNEFSLHKKLSIMQNHKTCRFDSEGMELTCVASNEEFSLKDDSREIKIQGESVNDFNLDNNLKLLDSSRTHHFTSDKMELTCAVKNCTDLEKMINDESCLNSHRKNLSSIIISQSNRHQDETGSQSDEANALHFLDVGEKNILNSKDREKQYKNCYSVEAFPGECKSPDSVDDSNLSLPENIGDKYADRTSNSHEMELTLMADKSHKTQASSFFHLPSHSSSISEGKKSYNFQNGEDNFYKKFQITQPYLSTSCKNITEEKNSSEIIPCNSPDIKILQTKQLSDSVSSEDNGNVWDVVLKPLNSKDATLKMPLGLKKFMSRTPGAVYTLRKKRQQIKKNFLKEYILSPEVKNILQRSGRFNLKKPFSEMKAYSPVSYDHKKSLTFHSFGMEGSYTTGLEENDQFLTVQPFNSSFKALNENNRTTSNLTLASTNTLVEGSFKTEFKKIIQLPTEQALNSSHRAINENSGMTSITSLIPAPTSAFTSFVRPEANLSCQSTLLEEKNTQNFSQIRDKQKSTDFSSHLNESLGILTDSFVLNSADSLACEMSEIYPSKILPEKSLLKKESSTVQSAKYDLPLPLETSDLSMNFEKTKTCMKISHDNLSFSISQKEIKLKDPLLRNESETLNLKTRSNDQNAIENQDVPKDFTKTEPDFKFSEVKNTFISEKRKLVSVPLNSKSPDSQNIMDCNISEESAPGSTQNINLSEIKLCGLHETNNPVLLEKATIKNNISNFSGYMSNFEGADLQENSRAFVSKMAVSENEVSEQSENKAIFRTAITNFESLPEIKIPCEKNSPDKIGGYEQCKDMNIQNISVDHSAQPDDELNFGGNELKSSFNEISNLKNNFFMDSCNHTASLSGDSVYKTNNQKNSDSKFPLNRIEINDVIQRTPNVDESMKVITVQVNENESTKEAKDMVTSGYCSDFDPLLDLDSLRSKFERGSKGTHWKIKSLKKEEAVFKLEWEVWLYKYLVNIHVKSTILGESSITSIPCFDDPDDEYETLGYKFFQFLAKDEVVSFSLSSDNMIEKLIEYSNIVKRVETLMRDIMHVSIDEIHTLSDDLDPLKLCVEVLNEKHMSQLLLIFHVNLRTYPSEKILPEVKHLNFKDITKEVKQAITNIEPGENYLWNMVKLASDL